MKIHKMKLSILPFKKIINGKKVIESRLYDEKRRQINPGDRIDFICNNDLSKSVPTTVIALYHYSNFENLFSDFSPSFFGRNSKEELVEEIRSFYSKEEQEEYGVIGIKIKIIS